MISQMSSAGPSTEETYWPHAPVHRLTHQGAFMVTAGTYGKAHLFKDGPRLRMLHEALLRIVQKHEWHLEAWAVFPNHYHFIAQSSKHPETLESLIRELHSRTARALNQHDSKSGRKVWHNYWETHLTFENSYFARLHYVHSNPVRHGLVAVANLYPCCSAAWFERTASPAAVRTVYSFKTEELNVEDDF
jgi:putative transposase